MSELPKYDFGVGIEIPMSTFEGRAADIDIGYKLAIAILNHWSENHLSEDTNEMLRCAANAINEAGYDLVDREALRMANGALLSHGLDPLRAITTGETGE